MLREYAENRWFTGENKVAELHAKHKEVIAEHWSAEMEKGEQNDQESELYFLLKEQQKERDALFSHYSKKYHAIHDLVNELDNVK